MKKTIFFSFIVLLFLSFTSYSQTSGEKTDFAGAQANLKEYRVVYQLDNDDEKVIKTTLRNIQNALEDPRLKSKLKVELVVHGAGIAVFMKQSPYEEQLKRLRMEGVLLAQCMNTMREKGIIKDQLLDFISIVPSGNGELIIRQQEGWAYIHP
jgi:uncharacterized protein